MSLLETLNPCFWNGNLTTDDGIYSRKAAAAQVVRGTIRHPEPLARIC